MAALRLKSGGKRSTAKISPDDRSFSRQFHIPPRNVRPVWVMVCCVCSVCVLCAFHKALCILSYFWMLLFCSYLILFKCNLISSEKMASAGPSSKVAVTVSHQHIVSFSQNVDILLSKLPMACHSNPFFIHINDIHFLLRACWRRGGGGEKTLRHLSRWNICKML